MKKSLRQFQADAEQLSSAWADGEMEDEEAIRLLIAIAAKFIPVRQVVTAKLLLRGHLDLEEFLER